MVKDIQSLLQKDDKLNLEHQIATIENSTEAELVVMVVRNSVEIGTARLLIGFLFAMISISIPYLNSLISLKILESYSNQYSYLFYSIKFILFGLLFTIGFNLNWAWLFRLLIPNQDEINQVWKRAQLEFYLHQMDKTKNKTGVLIFISLLEQRVVVYGDSTISKFVEQQIWDTTVQKIIAGIKSGGLFTGLQNGIQDCGSLLVKYFPITKTSEVLSVNENELPNQIIFKN